MGLDQYVFAKTRDTTEEIGYWRMHPDLHGWMEHLWDRKRLAAGNPRSYDIQAILDHFFGGPKAEEAELFNCVDLPLSEQDILDCMETVRKDELPETEGFCFGESENTKQQRKQDLGTLQRCLDAVRQGKEVFYSSWW